MFVHLRGVFTIDSEALSKKKKGNLSRFNTDKFLFAQLTAGFDETRIYYRLEYGDRSISIEQVQAVWMRCTYILGTA
ncbi:MvdC/MvdD family ATP grasp protein [Tolypothrix bouteillei VB521301_2]|uniref:MvdC/MvdD family ATP grasp protein n=1 Tax=Tolypothrix bouteillei TaxID=1246981 RepID=UPI0038B5C3C0